MSIASSIAVSVEKLENERDYWCRRWEDVDRLRNKWMEKSESLEAERDQWKERAEAAGWDFSFRPLGSEFCDCRSINMSTRLRIESPPETTAGKAIDAVLPAITAIERYPDAVKLLEEAKEVLRKQRDFDFERDDGARIHNESMDFLAKLEAHHAR